MKTYSPPEIIEVIDDDGDAFVQSSSTWGTHEAGRGARWGGAVAATVLLTVVAYTSATETSIPTPNTPRLIDAQYFVADPPAGFNMYLAEARGDGGSNAAHFDDAAPAELWATDDATATTGSWFLVSLGAGHSTGRNSYRTIIDGTEVMIEHDPKSGQVRLSFTKNGAEMTITAFGWIDRQLVRLVRAVNFDNSVIGFSDGFFTSDHRRILRTDPASALFGVPVTRVGYTTGEPTELAESFSITVAGHGTATNARVLKFAMTDVSPFAVGAAPAVIGRSAADPTVSIVQWSDSERLITLQGNLGPQRLASIARTVHESSAASVHQQVEAARPPVVAAMEGNRTTVVSGVLSDGWDWTIQVSARDPDDPAAGYLWWIGQPGDQSRPSETRPSQPGDAPTIDTFVENGRTYVLAKVPRSMTGAQLHVAPTGLPSIVTDLHNVGPALPGQFAASVFFEPVPFTARILDADGATVAYWPTFGRAQP